MKHNLRVIPTRRGQRGISLVLGLIMLILLTLLAISAFQATNVNLRIAGNMQVRQEALGAAQSGIETVLSSTAFIDTTTPPAAIPVNQNGATYTVNFTPAPACYSVVDIPSEDLDPTNPDDFTCIPSAALPGSGSGIFLGSGPPTAPSYCSNSRWTVIAHVSDANTGSDTTLEQGVAVRMSKAKALTNCP